LAAQAGTPGLDAGSIWRGGRVDVATLRRQTPLPETADELCAVARRLNAGDDNVRLGARLTERAIRQLSPDRELQKYALLHCSPLGWGAANLGAPGEPALLLPPPADPDAKDEGLLTASKVTELVLNADWVVMSACNTAAGDTESAEALSGLARAFFYAGARALLVSHWAVYSDATVKLITKTLSTLASDKTIGRSEALRRSMVALIEHGALHESHPAYWAPFVVVGEGGPGEPAPTPLTTSTISPQPQPPTNVAPSASRTRPKGAARRPDWRIEVWRQ